MLGRSSPPAAPPCAGRGHARDVRPLPAAPPLPECRAHHFRPRRPSLRRAWARAPLPAAKPLRKRREQPLPAVPPRPSLSARRGHAQFVRSAERRRSLPAGPAPGVRGQLGLSVLVRCKEGARAGFPPRVQSGPTWRRGRVSTYPGLAARCPPPSPAIARAADSPGGGRGLRDHVARAQRFRFSEEPGPGAPGAELEVCVPQVLHLQYGMYVWPCAVVLAQYLWFHRRSLSGKAVLEIGAGVSLPGILAAKCGAEVILSDSLELPHCLEACRQSCRMNNLPQVQVLGLTWGHVSQELLALPPQDIILASDVFFEPEDFEDILTTVYFLMQKNSKVQFLSTYQVRSADWSLEALLYKWDMKCVHIPLDSFDADKEDIAGSTLPGRHTVEMLVISYAKDII